MWWGVVGRVGCHFGAISKQSAAKYFNQNCRCCTAAAGNDNLTILDIDHIF